MRATAEAYIAAAALALAFAPAAGAGEAVKDSLSRPAAELSVSADTAPVQRGGGNPDTAGYVDANDTNAVDGGDAANAVDTISGGGDSSKTGGDSAETGKRPPAVKPYADSTPRLSGAYWGFGIGLSVGNTPIFPMWRKYFPDSLGALGLSPAFERNDGDAASLRYRVIESPDAFNFALPFCLSLYSIGGSGVFSFTVSFFRNSKEFQSELSVTPDTAARRISVLERLSFYSASMEAAARLPIPPAFFSIDGAQQAFFTITLGASPVNTFSRESEFKMGFDGGDARMQSAADSVKKAFAALSGNGLSLSWRAGISAIKRYPSGYGAEFAIFYSGAYSGYFYSDGVRLTEEHITTRGADLNAEDVTNGKPLSFLSNQAEFRVTILVPAKRRDAPLRGAD